jgi:2-haloacid dehalogenase/putative hydrolase of the HAD superfamily
MRLYDVVTFDCYGTLIDWEGGIGDAFARAAARVGQALDPRSLLAAYASIEPEVESGPYRSYREILRMTAARAAGRCGWALSEDSAGFLPESLPSWTPFPDTNPSLALLASAGVKLGILSNVDEQLLSATCRHFSVSFDLVVTAESVRSYKPGHAHFLEARERLGTARWLHAAQSYFHDVVPCLELGIPVAWINRKNEVAGSRGPAGWEFRDLARFADWLVGGGRA